VVVTNAKPGQVTGVSPDQNAQKNGSVQY